MSNLRIFWCPTYMHISNEDRSKLDPNFLHGNLDEQIYMVDLFANWRGIFMAWSGLRGSGTNTLIHTCSGWLLNDYSGKKENKIFFRVFYYCARKVFLDFLLLCFPRFQNHVLTYSQVQWENQSLIVRGRKPRICWFLLKSEARVTLSNQTLFVICTWRLKR